MSSSSNTAERGGRRRPDSPDWGRPCAHGSEWRKRRARQSSGRAQPELGWSETAAIRGDGEARVRPQLRKERGSRDEDERGEMEHGTATWGLIPTSRRLRGGVHLDAESGDGRQATELCACLRKKTRGRFYKKPPGVLEKK